MNARQVAQLLEEETKNTRMMPQVAESTKRAMQAPSFCVYNVGPWAQSKSFGTMGIYSIFACPEDKPYVKMWHHFGDPVKLVDWFPEIIHDYVPDDEKNMKAQEYDARYIAEQFLGVGRMLPPGLALTKYGVGVSAGLEPTKEELKASTDKLQIQLEKFVQEARNAWAKGPTEANIVISELTHHVAARRLNLSDEPWMKYNSAKQRQQCPMCGTYSDLGIIKCAGSGCGWIFDEDAYISLMSEQKRRIDARLAAGK